MMTINPRFLQRLQKSLKKGCLLTHPDDCLPYGNDKSRYGALPDAVVLPHTTTEVQRIIQCCNTYNVPVTPYGAGSGTTGGAVPVQGGIVLSLEKMNKILEFSPADRFIKVEAGVFNQTVQDKVHSSGLFFAPDPGSSAYCTIGGNIACNAAGPRAVKYGATRDHVLGLTAVTGAGEMIHTGNAVSKSATGYDLTRLLTGSEGTLAVVTEAILKLTPLSDFNCTIQVVYKTLSECLNTVTAILAQPHLPAALEFLDKTCLKLIDYPISGSGYMLLLNIDEKKAKKNIISILKNSKIIDYYCTENINKIKKIWDIRKSLSPALRKISPYKINEDIVVPISKISILLKNIHTLSKKHKVPIVNFGHIGNGNIHVNILAKQADNCVEELFNLVIRFGGTLSGEHGIGLSKKNYLPLAIEKSTLEVMKNIKKVFDPRALLNPGKIFPGD